MSDAPAPAPPTTPGSIPEAGVPNSRVAIAAIVSGVVGLLLPLLNVAAIVLGIVALRRIRASGRRLQGQGLAIVGICAGVVGVGINLLVGTMVWSLTTTMMGAMATFTPPSPVQVHNASVAHAQRTGGVYPRHVAELIVAKVPTPVQVWVVEVVPATAGKVTVGEYDLVAYDGTAQADASLRAAIKKADMSAPYYKFGDCWFVRLDEPRWSDDLIAAWSVNSAGEVQLVSDASHAVFVDAFQWDELWAADAIERERLGLDPLSAPPYPTPAAPTDGGDG